MDNESCDEIVASDERFICACDSRSDAPRVLEGSAIFEDVTQIFVRAFSALWEGSLASSTFYSSIKMVL